MIPAQEHSVISRFPAIPIDVYPTTPNPSRVASSVNSPSDTGAVFLLESARADTRETMC